MTFRILVTNDDGISAPGLRVAEELAIQLSGKKSNVITVAPALNQSGVGHSISYIRPSLISKCGFNRYSVEGTPADCVLAGIYYIMKDEPPDLIISGVNKGHNISEDVLYSGTVGAAMEGALQQIKSISLSQCYSKETLLLKDPFETSRAYAQKICSTLMQKATWNKGPYQTFYNVNFPAVRASQVQGFIMCGQGKREKGSFSMEVTRSPNGETFLWVNHQPKNISIKGSVDQKVDLNEIENRKITVTPLNADLTSYKDLEKLKTEINNEY